MPPDATPTWIFPVIPGANNSVYTAFSFQYEMWRPLYWSGQRHRAEGMAGA